MKKLFVKILPSVCFLVFVFSAHLTSAQTDSNTEIKQIFSEFENGIRTGAVKEFSNNLISETYISLENGESSYYSSNQSFYILKDFLQNYKPISFKFITTTLNQERPYAIGKLIYSKNGIRGESQVFIALKKEYESWKISQIIIN